MAHRSRGGYTDPAVAEGSKVARKELPEETTTVDTTVGVSSAEEDYPPGQLTVADLVPVEGLYEGPFWELLALAGYIRW